MSDEYISIKAATDAFCAFSEAIMHRGKPSFAVNYPAVLRSIPPEDVVPVVRCKDCRHRSEDDDGLFWCIGRGSPAHLVEPDGFCDRGRRK